MLAAAPPANMLLPGLPRGDMMSPQMLRCLLLAALLHLWLVLLLGNAPGGTAQKGTGSWGAVNITLRGPQSPGATDLQAPPEPLPPSGPAGTALSPRFGGAVREAGPAPAPEPGAAQLGNWTATPLPLRPDSNLPTAASPTPRVDATQASSGPPPTQGLITEPRATELPATTPGPLPVPAPPPVPMPAAEPSPTPAIERSTASTIDRDSTRAAPVLPITTDTLNGAAQRAPALPARLPDLAAPLPPLPAPPAPPVAAQAPAVPAAVAAPDLTPAAAPAPLVPAPPVLRSFDVSAPASVSPTGVAPLQADPTGATAPTFTAPSLPSLAGPVLAAPVAPAAPVPTGPDAGSRVGTDVATPASQPASAPRLNLQLARPRGAELSRGGGTGVLQLLPRPPEVASKLSKDIEKAGKADCKNAYGGGLLAVVPLVLDAVRQDGCKW
jgi:hypothetical protein